MTAGKPEPPRHSIVRVLKEAHGLDIGGYSNSVIQQTIDGRVRELGKRHQAEYLKLIEADLNEASTFERALRVSYSEFFRGSMTFGLLEEWLLPTLVDRHVQHGSDELRIWSAACASGQEAWSLAILLDEINQNHRSALPFRIFASDLSEEALAMAKKAVYPNEMLGNVRLRHFAKYFTKQTEHCSIVEHLRKHVIFSRHDLLDRSTSCPPESIYGGFDLVLCCNVLLYFRQETQIEILDRLGRCLARDGILITGDTERHLVEAAGGFQCVRRDVAVFQRTERSPSAISGSSR